MNPIEILYLLLAYFVLLYAFSVFVTKNKLASNTTFFVANKQANWLLVAFGMLGATLSGITFISIPGKVETAQFSYFQLTIGYVFGYAFVAMVLLPLYYKRNLTSIYSYLGFRFGLFSQKTAAWLFLVSKLILSSLRLYLVAAILQNIVFNDLQIPFEITVTFIFVFIWLYTYKSGMQTIIWTDIFQTFFMLLSLLVCIYMVASALNCSMETLPNFIFESNFSKVFFFEDLAAPSYFWKHFFAGAFIVIAMTGLDQDIMQKNLACKNLKEAQKNMFWFTIALVVVTFLFLVLGLLFTEYALKQGIDAHQDALFPILATQHLGAFVAISFCIGLVAATFSSADGALTALTTSFCIDILNMESKYEVAMQQKIRLRTHSLITFISIICVLLFHYTLSESSIIDQLLKFVSFIYGPLLGLYGFGLFTKWQIKDKLVPIVAILSIGSAVFLSLNSQKLFGFVIGFEIIILNGLLSFLGLILIRRQKN